MAVTARTGRSAPGSRSDRAAPKPHEAPVTVATTPPGAGPDGGLRVDRDHGLARGIIGARSLGTLDRLLQSPEDL